MTTLKLPISSTGLCGIRNSLDHAPLTIAPDAVLGYSGILPSLKSRQMTQAVQGYAEGYYGHLLSWPERCSLLDTLLANGQNTYYYAPKEDARHRLHWREPYDAGWREQFRDFCQAATQRGIRVVAGVAPGIDFDYAHLPRGSDMQALLGKSRQLLADGATCLSLLMDDIDADFHTRNAGIRSEGLAHARLANEMGDILDETLWVTPRIYANELAGSAPDYLPDFLDALDTRHSVLYCGSDIVARRADPEDIRQVAPDRAHRVVIWDNLYANDYCPQRLFTGAWLGRDAATEVLLNPTGMVHTDCLLLDMMASYRLPMDHQEAPWKAVLARHGVPRAFEAIAPYAWHPVFNGEHMDKPAPPSNEVMDAIEECLWRWKSPLSREWYPFLFGLKLDLMLQQGSMTPLRMCKTLNSPLVARLCDGPKAFIGPAT